MHRLAAYLSILLSSLTQTGPSPTVGLLHSKDLHSLKVNTPWWELQWRKCSFMVTEEQLQLVRVEVQAASTTSTTSSRS